MGNRDGSGLRAGAAAVDVSPVDSQFLQGYPHVERYSTGVHDPLMSSALYLACGAGDVLFVANDILFVPREVTARARARIESATGVPASRIFITATHTHSGPITVDYLSTVADRVVPKADPSYLLLLENGIVKAATDAHAAAVPAEIAFAVADGKGVGTNRRDPAGPTDLEVPVVYVRKAEDASPLALMLVLGMHPTVLHEDSTLASGDFPGMARQYLQREVVGVGCPVLHHTGPSGNQSPRHVTRGNTFDEAERLGSILGRAVECVLSDLTFVREAEIASAVCMVELVPREFPSVADAEEKLTAVKAHLDRLRADGAPKTEVRTAECDWFGAEETLTLARAAEDGRLAAIQESYRMAEVGMVRLGPRQYVLWPCEIFVEYALAVRNRYPDAFVISLSGGETQGYIVTPEAEIEGGYEASNGLFAAASGQSLVDGALSLLE